MEKVKSFIPVGARVLLAAIFVLSGLGKLSNWSGTADYMASAGMILVPLFLVGAILIEVVGGLLLMVGFKAHAAATALIVFLIAATLTILATPPKRTELGSVLRG